MANFKLDKLFRVLFAKKWEVNSAGFINCRFVTSPIKEEISKPPAVEEEPAVVDATIKPAPSSENLDKSKLNLMNQNFYWIFN